MMTPPTPRRRLPLPHQGTSRCASITIIFIFSIFVNITLSQQVPGKIIANLWSSKNTLNAFCHVNVWNEKQCAYPVAAFAAASGGGGGFGVSKKKNKKSKTKSSSAAGGGFGVSSSSSNINKKKKKKTSILSDMAPPPKEEINKKEEGPKLDRFGLPIQTEDDIFPPLPPTTELIPVSNDKDITLEDIKDATKHHLGVDYSMFDENGVEKTDKKCKMKLRLLHKSPPVLAIDNFFTPEECNECLSLATPTDAIGKNLKINSATFSSLAQSKRTSTTWFCHYSQLPTLLAKTTKLLHIPLQQLEEPQVVRYRTGEEFSWHYDEIPISQLDNGGQRLGTLLVYLNTLEQGGATMFRDLTSSSSEQLAMKPKKGAALLFFPAYKDGTPDDRTLHKGEVAIDEKMIAQIWIHERTYRPVVPEGNSHEEAVEGVMKKCEELGYTSSS